MTEEPDVDLSLHRQQGRALRCPGQEILYGGAAGGGKSHLIRAAEIVWALSAPGLQCYLFRRTFPELVDNHLNGPGRFREMLARLVAKGLCRIAGKDIKFANGSAIHLRHLQHEKDLNAYQGTEIHVLGIDEATHFTESEYRYLRGRVRLGGWRPPDDCPWTFPRILLGTNPGGKGHHWAKRDFVDHGPYRIHRAAKDQGGMLRCFIPAKLDDNPSMLRNDPEYRERLEGLGDEVLVRALLDGDWEVVAGAMYGKTWRKDRHTCEPFPIPWEWPIWIGADDGFDAPAAFYWLTQDPRTKTVFVIRELYRAEMLPEDAAERIKRIHDEIPRCDERNPDRLYSNEEPIRGILDSAAFADSGQTRKKGEKKTSRGDQLRKLGVRLKPCAKGAGSRALRAKNLHRMLATNPDDPAKRPRLIIFRGECPNLIRTLPTLSRDSKDRDAVDTDEEDHGFDGLTYGLQWTGSGARTGGIKGT